MSITHVAFHWSGGKDSALAVSLLLGRDDVRVDRLVTTVHAERRESTVHGVSIEALEAQARSIGIPLSTVDVPGPGLVGYTEAMETAAREMRDEGIDAFGFGDLHCSGVLDLKKEQFGPLGLDVVVPLWELTSQECIELFLESGIRARTVVVDASVLDRSHLGVLVDREFVERLPVGVDPCGEFGEFHSFAFDGPLFAEPAEFTMSPARHLKREVGTTDGPRTYEYWLSSPVLST